MTSGSRYLGLAMSLFLAAACSRPETAPVPRPIVPTDGPRVSIYTSVTGGLLNRRVDAVFKVDESAYVLVGHLAADGSVDIIYPATPYEAKPLRGPQRVRTRMFDASPDVNLALFNASRLRYRPMTARFDSYDGSGQGYVFIVASRMPLNYGAFSAGKEWDRVSIDNYNESSDPRLGIREFADELAAGASYSIGYARAWTSVNYNQFANSFDCVLAASLSYDSFTPWFGGVGSGWYFSPFNYGYPIDMSRAFGLPCGNSLRYAYFERRPPQLAYTPQLNPSNPRPPDPKTTRAWAPRTRYNPRTVGNAYRNRGGFDDPFPAKSGRAATWSNAGGSPSGSAAATCSPTRSANGTRASSPRRRRLDIAWRSRCPSAPSAAPAPSRSPGSRWTTATTSAASRSS